tara:strand:+ start:61732 stop:62760 length:1029 start_codon:yes stop_codon:yes gene_type:complete
MKIKKNSIKDIAEANGVSVTTVSFVLNGKAEEKKISKVVTDKILKYVKKINYRPNQIAQSLRTGKTNIIVFMVEDISNHFFAKLARIIEDIAYDKGYKVLFCSNDNNDEKSLELIDLFKDRGVDGFIIIPSGGIELKIKELISEDIPVVLFDRYFFNLDSNQVVVDNKEASYNAMQHVIKNGYKNIGFVSTDVDQTQMLDRLQGYKNAVSEASLEQAILRIPLKHIPIDDGKKQLKNFLINNPQLDAIYFATNYLAINGLMVMKEDFPNYITEKGIIAFDDIDLFKLYSPTITAVQQPLEKIATKLMDTMLNLLDSDKKSRTTVKAILNTDLIIRESTRLRS